MTLIDMRPEAPEPPALPYWQDRPCPNWCAYSDDHCDDSLVGDRSHQGLMAKVVLTLEDPELTFTADHHVSEVHPGTLELCLTQDYREIGPRIHVSHNEGHHFYLTPEEAAQLSEILSAFGRQGGALPAVTANALYGDGSTRQ